MSYIYKYKNTICSLIDGYIIAKCASMSIIFQPIAAWHLPRNLQVYTR